MISLAFEIKLCFWSVILLILILPYTISEHRKLIPKCSNSCLNPDSVRPLNCFCDIKCSMIYNDCCLDAPYRMFRVNNKRWHNNHCLFVHGENKHFWMVDTCKDTWSGHEYIREKCENHDAFSNDIMTAIPVTSPSEAVTYRNYYCTLCNEEDAENLLEWRVKALCRNESITEADVQQNLTFVEDRQQWGVWKNGDLEFHDCFLLFQRPPGIDDGIRECVSGMVSTCPSSWKNIVVRRKCKSYVDPIKFPDSPVYRNIDCAVCHNKTKEDFRCVHDVTKGSSAVMLDRAFLVDLSATGQWL
ncbi:uncharacterized protein LOC129227588 [Uloborus diversus]|uniref:uncharacterized protein LOC129227588 n=1 Tax=Uloborus diversus TaxID=327109 RepID=UPI00240A8F8B|nr:uncharacterized protein LOC129227588 [Uloborus diversus]